MTISKDETLSELERAIELYQTALENISSAQPGPSEAQAMAVLTARDAVQAALNEEPLNSAKSRATVCELDSRLKKQGKAIASAGSLPEWRESLQPPESAWWWFFQPPLNRWMRFDWLWNALTISALALSASLIVDTLQSLAVKGLTWQQSFGAILQGAGLAAIGSGALTSDGQQKVRNILKKTGVPERFQSEATLVVSLMVLGGVYSLYNFLPDRLYESGLSSYQLGELSDAEESFLQALQLSPDDERINIALGEAYESLGSLEQAIAQYKQALSSGDPRAFNNLGRVYIDRIDPILKRKNQVLAETYLRMGLQRAYSTQAKQEFTAEELVNIKYQLYRNLGWVLLEQKKYAQAEEALKKAVKFDNLIDKLQIGSYMSQCLLAKLYKIQGDERQQQIHLRNCRMLARPETLNEYKRLIKDEGTIAKCIDTNSIVTGLDKLPVEFNDSCQAMAIQEPSTAVTDPAKIEALRQNLSANIQEYIHPRLSEKIKKFLSDRNDELDPVERDLVYWVTVGKFGDVVAFEPRNKLASDGVQYTPLITLFNLTHQQEKLEREELVIFNVLFSPDGSFQVNPLSSEEKALAQSFRQRDETETTQVKTITDPAKIEALRVQLFDEIDRTWRIVPSFNQNLVYQVSADADGAIASYEPVNELGIDFVAEIPLPQLVSPNATEPLAQFKVVFSPFGALEVTPWQE